MLKIRLQRYGRTNDPSFRVVVLEGTRGPKAGNHVDQIGFYNAVTKQKSLDTEKAKYWISKGAQPSDTVYNMLVAEGAVAGKKRNALPKKTPIVKEQPAEVAAPAASVETPAEAVSVETPTEPVTETPVQETPVESAPETQPEEKKEEAQAEEPKAE